MKINSLSMVAEDFSSSTAQATALYKCIRAPLISNQTPVERKLPLVYVIDSLLKNVRGKFIPLIETDAKTWIPVVFEQMGEEQRAKLRKVWNTWRDYNLFSEKNWEEMGVCFVEADGIAEAKKTAAEAKAKAAGIGRKVSRHRVNILGEFMDFVMARTMSTFRCNQIYNHANLEFPRILAGRW